MVKYQNNLVEIISQNSNTIVIVINRNGELTYISNSVEKILGYQPEELLGEYWWKATRKDENSALNMLENFKSLVKENKIEDLSTERLLFDSNGNKKWILWNSSFDNEGNVISVGYDITKRKINERRLQRSNKLLRNKNNEILDSLNYARSIQNSILPQTNFYEKYFSDGFLYYQAKDIVSGDFYWCYEFNELVYIACIDCTGHGVPGALMTILANNLLKNVIKHQQLEDPAKILHAIDELLYEEFNKEAKIKRSDGMDLSLCVFDFNSNKLSFAGALQSLYYLNKLTGKLSELKGKRYPIGLYHDVEKTFVTESVSFQKGDKFFLTTDGYVDQFGGEKNLILGKKFTKKRLKDLLLEESNMKDIHKILKLKFESWKGKLEQTDDILMIGLEI